MTLGLTPPDSFGQPIHRLKRVDIRNVEVPLVEIQNGTIGLYLENIDVPTNSHIYLGQEPGPTQFDYSFRDQLRACAGLT